MGSGGVEWGSGGICSTVIWAREEGVETKGWGRAQVCWKDRTFEQSAVGGNQWAWNNGDNKSLPFHPLCLSLAPFLSLWSPSLPAWPTAAHHEAQTYGWKRNGTVGDRGAECITWCPSAHPHWQPLASLSAGNLDQMGWVWIHTHTQTRVWENVCPAPFTLILVSVKMLSLWISFIEDRIGLIL